MIQKKRQNQNWMIYRKEAVESKLICFFISFTKPLLFPQLPEAIYGRKIWDETT
jgi:hypothetical protein